jgi:hypothetical protein
MIVQWRNRSRCMGTAIIVRDGDRAKIMQETVTIAAPGQ